MATTARYSFRQEGRTERVTGQEIDGESSVTPSITTRQLRGQTSHIAHFQRSFSTAILRSITKTTLTPMSTTCCRRSKILQVLVLT